MKTTTTAENLPATLSTVAANDEFSADIDHLTDRPLVSEGWDPFEVWRTRVRLPQQELGLAPVIVNDIQNKKT